MKRWGGVDWSPLLKRMHAGNRPEQNCFESRYGNPDRNQRGLHEPYDLSMRRRVYGVCIGYSNNLGIRAPRQVIIGYEARPNLVCTLVLPSVEPNSHSLFLITERNRRQFRLHPVSETPRYLFF